MGVRGREPFGEWGPFPIQPLTVRKAFRDAVHIKAIKGRERISSAKKSWNSTVKWLVALGSRIFYSADALSKLFTLLALKRAKCA